MEQSDGFRFRLVRAEYRRLSVDVCVDACDCAFVGLDMAEGVVNSGSVSSNPSLANVTSSGPPHAPSMVKFIVGMDVKSGLSSSSDLKNESASGDCTASSHELQPSSGLEGERLGKMGEIGGPSAGDTAKSLLSSPALQSSMEL